MQVCGLQIDAGEVRFSQVDAGEVRPGAAFSARFHPLLVLIQNFCKIDQRNSDGASRLGTSSTAGGVSFAAASMVISVFSSSTSLIAWISGDIRALSPEELLPLSAICAPGRVSRVRIRATPAPTFESTRNFRCAPQSSLT